MPWGKLDDKAHSNGKLRRVSNDAVAVWFFSNSYSDDNLTDGLLTTREALGIIGQRMAPPSTLDELTRPDPETGNPLWEPVDGGYVIHDFLKYHKSKAQILDERAEAARRQEEWRSAHPKRKGPHTDSNGVTDGVTGIVRHTVTNDTSRYPVPGSPDPGNPDPLLESASAAAPRGRGLARNDSQRAWEQFVIAGFPVPITRSERGRWNAAIKELLDAGVAPSEIPGLVAAYRERYPSVDCTVTSIPANLSTLRSPMPRGRNGVNHSRYVQPPAGRSSVDSGMLTVYRNDGTPEQIREADYEAWAAAQLNAPATIAADTLLATASRTAEAIEADAARKAGLTLEEYRASVAERKTQRDAGASGAIARYRKAADGP